MYVSVTHFLQRKSEFLTSKVEKIVPDVMLRVPLFLHPCARQGNLASVTWLDFPVFHR